MASEAVENEAFGVDKNLLPFQQLTRRRIYYNRLIGDLGEQVRVQHAHTDPPHVVARFLLYAIIATYVAIFRCDIEVSFIMNSSIRYSLEKVSFKDSPGSTYFADINQFTIIDWFKECVLSQALGSKATTNPLAQLSFNRFLPSRGVCTNSATVLLTARIAQQEARPQQTTNRFTVFYTQAWNASTILPTDPPSGVDQASTLHRSHPYREIEKKALLEMVPGSVAGMDAFGNEIQEVPLSVGSPVFSEWAFSPEGSESFDGKGGFVALVILGAIGADNTLSSQNSYVVLLDPTHGESVNLSSIGLCDEFKVSNVMLFDDFVASEFLGSQLASLSLEFTLYNANMQTLTLVQSVFTFDATGFMSSKTNTLETVRIDIEPASNFWEAALQWIDLLYAISTLIYLLELIFRTWRNWRKVVRDLWTYVTLASIITSLMSLITFFLYRQKMQGFATSDGFIDTKSVSGLIADFAVFRRCSALAIFTIYWRLLQFLANVKARVRLLMQTLAMSAGSMAIYISFIIVIFYGFSTFAWTTFASQSLDFAGLPTTMISCFNMFMGRVQQFDALPESFFKNIFLFLFMIFFFFISAQMFNAIINYSYNRVSERMEAHFERERAEGKRKELQRKLESEANNTYWRRAWNAMTRLFQRSTQVSDDKDKTPTPSMPHNNIAAVLDAPNFDNIKDDEAKEKIEKFMKREKRRKAPDGLCSRFVFILFAVSYFAFLYLNVAIYENAQMQKAIQSSIQDHKAIRPVGSLFTFSNIVDLQDMITWLQELKNILWGVSPGASPDIMLSNDDATCLNPLLCVVPGASGMVRLTQRYVKVFSNTGGVYNSNSSSSSTLFSGGISQTGRPRSQILAATRRPRDSVLMTNPPDLEVETAPTYFNAEYNQTPICKPRQVGEGGYREFGGLVCMLDAKQNHFEAQLAILVQSGFFNLAMGGLVADFVAYNSNADVLAYVELTFGMLPSGRVTTNMVVGSTLLLSFADFRNQPSAIIGRLLPGIVYVVLVFYFIVALFRDLASECYRKQVNEGMGTIAATIEFFTLDIFNALEAVSITISVVSAIMFVAFLRSETAFDAKLQGSGEELIQYVSQLMVNARAYNRLSAVNMLIIFVRPLEFTRENARMAKLNQTLFDARIDIMWFVVMLFICMFAFVMFAHISFGGHVEKLAGLGDAITYCFYYILGSFDYYEISIVDPLMAVIFFFPYLFLFYCVFTNIFFAIIDRNFVTAEPPPFNLKRTLKPALGRICRCIEWDEDYAMEESPNATRDAGPPSRRYRVHETALRIEEILNSAGDIILSAGVKNSKLLNEVCDVDERLSDAMHWSKEEAKKFVEKFRLLLIMKIKGEFKSLSKKQGPKKIKSEGEFIKEVMKELKEEQEDEKLQMEEAARHQRYAIQVHERLALRDQDTLGNYIQLLEAKIKKLIVSKEARHVELQHLRSETDIMRFNEEERNRSEGNNKKQESLTIAGLSIQKALDNPQHSGSESGSSDSEGATRGAEQPTQRPFDPTAPIDDEQIPRSSHQGLYEQLGKHLWED